ncbi:MAG: DUF4783 domain-containing protein [Bacteroidetes bacterium]|uniref:DUF4783 domain-containing protein n=1 Tax=Candidatus Cryptobacteroides avistercoris TaxID=2840758 RepID=A0A9D9NNL4_9BACT|nr:DUF4783 domain-containing protein [Candidatus Cryptobacteroides avistercoris]
MKITAASFLLLLCLNLSAQSERYDVFLPISKYMLKGDAECLSAWFDDNLDLSIISEESTASKAQAKQILKAFFSSHTPQSFDITHAAEKANMKYALGSLTAGGEDFMVTIFVSSKGRDYKIQQLKIERM